MRIITIKRGRCSGYQVVADHNGRAFSREAKCPGEAAAIAYDFATVDSGSYCIIGCKESVDMIPPSVRHR